MRAWQRARAATLSAAASCAACGGPSLDSPVPPPPVVVSFEPAAVQDAVPSVFRARLEGGAERGEPWLLKDELSDYFERALRRGELPETLGARAVPLRYWREGSDWLVQPLTPLEPGASYSLALRGLGQVTLLRAAAGSPPLTRFFPVAGRPKHRFALMCGLPQPIQQSALVLQPRSIPLRISSGTHGSPAEGCIGLHVEAPLVEPVVAPPFLGAELLEPSPFLPEAQPASPAPSTCPGGQLAFGACLETLDDRLLVTQLNGDALWLVSEPQTTKVAAVAFAPTVLLRGLAPSTEIFLSGEVVTSSGSVSSVELHLTTQPERSHVLLNEVLANAAGPEPASEWVELVNDSERPASLAGLWLEDATGHVALPPQQLAPGEFALLVGSGFQPSGLDVPLPAAARVIELGSLGQRGLSNSGEALMLVGPSGVVSRFPALAAPHAGRSLARRSFDAVDDQSLSFCEHAGPGASPAAPNSCD